MARYIHHMSMNLEGCLRNHKRKKITFIEDDNGIALSDKQARAFIAEQIANGHKLMCCSNECEGFDPFDKGCPGHEIKEE